MKAKTKLKHKNFTFNVYGQDYDVIFQDNVYHPISGQECCGLCDPEVAKIYINNKMDKSLTTCTVLHELFHAYSRRMGMENSGMSAELEEILADQFGTLLEENFDFTF